MGGSQKSKRVSWPSDDNLCQVRLFLSEDSPAQVGFGSQDHLQAKIWPSNSNSLVSDENLPPGFEGTHPANNLWNKLPQIPLIKWRCPPRFHLDEAWRVVAGDESTEFERENNRVNKVLEAIYPRESSIPPDPNGVGLEDSFANDKPPILIPITPIEDEDGPSAADGYLDSGMMNPSPMGLHAQTQASLASSSHYAPPAQGGLSSEIIPGVDPAIVSAANAALSAVMSNNNQANLIDRDLLIKILSDPKMVEQLVKNHGTASTTSSLPATGIHNAPPSVSMQSMAQNNPHIPSMAANSTQTTSSTTHNMPVTSMQNRLRPVTPGINFSEPPSNLASRTAHMNRPEFVAPPMPTTNSGGVYYPPPPGRIADATNQRPPAPDMIRAPSQPLAKDISYYKSLIQQHGGDKPQDSTQYSGGRSNHHLPPPVREPPPNVGGRPRDLKPKIMKPCMYYNTARGCRNGANCAFQHDDSSAPQRVSGGGLPDSQSAKRMKMDREITGT